MKRRLNYEKLYMFVLLCITVVSLTVIGIQWIILHNGARALDDQLTSSRWSEDGKVASISMYVSEDLLLDEMSVLHMRSNIENAIKEQAFENDHPNGRIYIDSYCATDVLTINNEKKTAECVAYGVGGDFFLFHPLKIVYGTYFDESELMDDYIVMDRETAWTIFGGDDVEGKLVYVNGTPLTVRGVYERSATELDEFAGNGEPSIFISYSMLKKLTGSAPITCYEVTLPDPVEKFAYNLIKDHSIVEEKSAIYIENSDRFSYDSYINVYKERNARSMRTNGIGFPYWENLARAKEDALMPVAMWQMWEMGILGTLWIVTIIALIIIHKPTKETFDKLFDWLEKMIVRIKRNKKEKKKLNEQEEIVFQEEVLEKVEIQEENISLESVQTDVVKEEEIISETEESN